MMIYGGDSMKKSIIGKCPVCGGKMAITALKCEECEVEIKGLFEIDDFFKLNNDQLHFVKTFVRNRGNIKEVEKELGISYPTVRNKLDEAIEAMGYPIEKDAGILRKRKEILSKLESGELSSNEAIEQLRELDIKE